MNELARRGAERVEAELVESVILHVYRYGAPETVECDSLEDAIRQAFWAVELNTASPQRIEVNGELVLERDQMRARWEELRLE